MNGLRCPKCDLVNLLSAQSCHRCGASLTNLPPTAQVSVPVDQTFQAQSYKPRLFEEFGAENETGRKTFFWYRIYCGTMLALYMLLIFFGAVLTFTADAVGGSDAQENMIIGIAYGLIGVVFALVYGIALFLPAKPYNWVVGIVMIAIGLTSCCFLPATVPLLIFWLKPETKAYFGRN